MTIFADASAMIAMIVGEAEADALANRLAADTGRLCSPLSAWETVTGLCRSYRYRIDTARHDVQKFTELVGLRFVTIGQAEYEIALDAYARFGKGRHPASLNLGDCFAYACAKANDAQLLYKGADFAKTDLAMPDPA